MKTKLTIEIAKETADAYLGASEEARERAEQAMGYALLSREERASTFKEMTTRMSEKARQRGLTPDELDKLLSEDDDA